MKLISVNVSLPKTVYHQGRRVNTGIYNEPVTGRVMVRKLNVDGDGQADLKVHGGVYKAVYIYDIENIRYWRKVLGRYDLTYGHFGENFTVEGMPDDRIQIGDVFRIGGALLEVTQPRVPCFKLEEEGEVGAGDSIERIRVGPEKITVGEFARLYYFDTRNLEKIRRILRIPSIPPGWSRAFEKLLATSGEKGKKRKTPERAWQGFRPFIVYRKVPESQTITSFYLVPEDGEPLPPYMPGQFLTFKLSNHQAGTTTRGPGDHLWFQLFP
jgi:MOSC domain-containing protein YiiM